MAIARWFEGQLLSTAEGFIWGVEQLPKERRNAVPPNGLGQWSALRHVFHLVYYEQYIALPCMRQWLGGSQVSPGELKEDEAWGGGHDLDYLLTAFRRVRYEQAMLLTQFDENAWPVKRDTVWNQVSLEWVVTKTLQHTADHTNAVMKLLLFWDLAVQRARAAAGQS